MTRLISYCDAVTGFPKSNWIQLPPAGELLCQKEAGSSSKAREAPRCLRTLEAEKVPCCCGLLLEDAATAAEEAPREGAAGAAAFGCCAATRATAHASISTTTAQVIFSRRCLVDIALIPLLMLLLSGRQKEATEDVAFLWGLRLQLRSFQPVARAGGTTFVTLQPSGNKLMYALLSCRPSGC